MKFKIQTNIKRNIIIGIIFFTFTIGLISILPVHAQSVFSFDSSILAATNGATSSNALWASSNYPYTEFAQWDSQLNLWFILYPTTSTGWTTGTSAGSITFDYIYSQDGQTWSNPIIAYISATSSANSCTYSSGRTQYDWAIYDTRITFAYGCNQSSTNAGIIYTYISISNINSPSQGSDTYYEVVSSSGAYVCAVSTLYSISGGLSIWESVGISTNFFIYGPNGVRTGYSADSCVRPISILTNGASSIGATGYSDTANSNPTYLINCISSSSCTTNNAGVGWYFSQGTSYGSTYTSFLITGASGSPSCDIYTYNWNSQTWSYTTAGGVGLGNCGYGNIGASYMISDNQNNVLAIDMESYETYWAYSTNQMATISNGQIQSTYYGSTGLTGYYVSQIITNPNSGNAEQAIMVLSSSTAGDIYTILITTQPTTSSTVTQTIGSCPTKDISSFKPVNSTIYLLYSNFVGSQESIQTITTFITNITGSVSQTLQLLIYTSSATSTSNVGIGTPLNLVFAQSYSITSGTTNKIINTAVNGVSGTQNQLIGIGFVSSDHIYINKSSISGLYSLSGNPSIDSQPSSFTSIGSTSAITPYLCATGQYQSIQTQTATITVTSGGVYTATSTTVITGLANPTGAVAIITDLVTFLPFWIIPLIFAKMLGMPGLLYGLMIALLLGIFMGLFPYWTIFIVIVMIYLALR
jgi:hypothetical protein